MNGVLSHIHTYRMPTAWHAMDVTVFSQTYFKSLLKENLQGLQALFIVFDKPLCAFSFLFTFSLHCYLFSSAVVMSGISVSVCIRLAVSTIYSDKHTSARGNKNFTT